MSKQVKITRLALVNFKGLRNVTVNFNGDGVTTISGRNGTGKTTVKDAFCWLLWGKDSEGNQDTKFGIKTNDASGNFIPDLTHEVTGNFQITDTDTGEVQDIELRRALVEEWKVPAGQTERQLKGHHTDYFCNGVPLKTKGEYDAKVASIIPETVFKIITDPYEFLTLDWKAQREMLLQIAGTVSPEEVAKGNAQFAALLGKLTGKTLDEYKREIAARKKKVSDRLDKIPTAIDAITRVTPVAPDFDALETERTQLEKEIADLTAAQTSTAEANRVAYETATKIQAKINEARSKQQSVLFKAQTDANNEAYRKNQAHEEAQRELSRLTSEAAEKEAYTTRRIKEREAEIARLTDEIARHTGEQERLRKEWYALNEQTVTPATFTESEDLVCPVFSTLCGDPATVAKYKSNRSAAKARFEIEQEKKRAAFEEDKKSRLAKITETGKSFGEAIARANARIAEVNTEIEQEKKAYAEYVADVSARKAAAEATLNSTPKVTAPTITGADIPAWQELEAEIASLTAQLPATTATETTDLAEKREAAQTRLDEVKRELTKRETIATNEAQIKQLKDEAATLAQEKADLQNTEATIEDFVRTQMDEVERKVNRLFSRVQFRMYKTLVNGDKQQDCIAYVDGVRYQDTNTASKVNAGLDVINTLCAFHEVNAPIFVDGAESINNFIPVSSQLIALVVTTGDFKVE